MTIDQFAESIKVKYPVYKDMDNTELAQKIVQKYPMYADKVEGLSSAQPTQGLGQKAVATIAKKPEPGVTDRIGTEIQTRGAKIEELLSGTSAETANQSPIRRGVEAVAQASGAVPAVALQASPEFVRKGAEAVGKVASGLFSTLTNFLGDQKVAQDFVVQHPKAAQALEEVLATTTAGGQIAGDILTVAGGAKSADVALDKSAQAVQKVAEVAGKGTKEAGKFVYKGAIRPTAQEAERIIGFEAKKQLVDKGVKVEAPILRVDSALEKGLMGRQKDLAIGARVQASKLYKDTIEPALKGSKDVMTKDELFALARKRVASEVEPARKASLQNALEALELDYKDFKPTDLATANKIKTSLATFTPSKIFKGQEVASEIKTLKADLASAIRDKTYETLKDSNIKRAYLDYGNLKELEKIGVKAITEGGKLGGFGGFWTSLFDSALTPIRTIGGQVLYRVGDKLEMLGKPGLKTFGDYAESQGLTVDKTLAGLVAPDTQVK